MFANVHKYVILCYRCMFARKILLHMRLGLSSLKEQKIIILFCYILILFLIKFLLRIFIPFYMNNLFNSLSVGILSIL